MPRPPAQRFIDEAAHRTANVLRTIAETRQQMEDSRRLLANYPAAGTADGLIASLGITKKIGDAQPS